MTEIELNEDQVTAILTEGLNRGLYECLNGALPEDSNIRSSDAHQLVEIAKNAFNNGNRSDNVQTILFIAQTDQSPLPVKEQKIAEAVANNDTVIYEKPPVESELESTVHNGIDLATLSDGVLEGLITGLDKYPQSEQVEEDRKAYLAEKERRNEKASKSQEDSQGTAAQEDGEKAGEAAPEGSPASVEGGNQTSPEGGAEDRDVGQDIEPGEADPAQGEDAGAFARAQTPETSPEGKPAKAKAQKEDGSRAELEQQLTLSIVKAYKADISKLDDIPTERIEYMLENPDGPPNNEEEKVAINESEIEAGATVNKEEKKAVSGIVADVVAPIKEVTKADLGLGEVEEDEPTLSEEREKLEALVTGPMIKAYRKGRKEIPSIGDNELRFMILNPDAKVSPEELEKSRALDGNIPENTPQSEIDNTVSVAEAYEPEKLADPVKISEEKDRTITEAAKKSTAKSPPEEEVNTGKFDLHGRAPWKDIKDAEEANKSGNTKSADKVFVEIDREETQQQNRAMEIISRENFPIPPAYSDEEAPVFPMDMSLCSRDELFSLHAKYHAYEMRINHILAEHEDKVNDLIQLRNYREAEVAKEIPFMGEDGKRNTNEYRDAQVRGDKEVLELGEKEHEAKKVVTDLKVHQKNYHLSCERLSRQMSKYETERLDAPR
jgi:hypothetical protein